MPEDFSLSKMNQPDAANMTDMMRKHTPVVEAPDKVAAGEPFVVTIKVGGIDGVNHPNALGHWINWVILHAGDRPLGRAEFAPTVTQPTATFHVTLEESASLQVVACCNLHGVWLSTKEVMVS